MELRTWLSKWSAWLCLAFAIGSAFEFHRMNNALQRRTEALAKSYAEYRKGQETLDPGVVLPAISGQNDNGDALRVAYEDKRRTVVLIFTPSCPYSRRNWTNWTQLISKSRPEAVRFVAINLHGKTDELYVKMYGLASTPLFASVDYVTKQAYKFKRVPTTLLVRPDGTLDRAWSGVLDGAAMSVLEKAVQSAPESVIAANLPADNQ